MTGPRFRTFILLWITQSLSTVGDFITAFAITVWLTRDRFPDADQRDELAFALAALVVAPAVVVTLLQPIFGVWADRYDRRRLMLGSDLANAALTAALAVLIVRGEPPIWALVAVATLGAALSEVHTLAFDASYSAIVPEDQLTRANGMMQTTMSLGDVAAPALAVGLMALAGSAALDWLPGVGGSNGASSEVAMVVAFDALSFALAAAALVRIRIPAPEGTELPGSPFRGIWDDVREGVGFVRRRPPIVAIFVMAPVATMALTAIDVMLPLLVSGGLRDDWTRRGYDLERALALIVTAGGIGGLVGGLAISAWGGLRRRLLVGYAAAVVVGGLGQIALGLSSGLYLAAGVWLLTAFMSPVGGAHARAILQRETPMRLQGRVFALRRLVAAASIPLAGLIAALSGAHLGASATIVGLGVAVVAVGGLLFAYGVTSGLDVPSSELRAPSPE